jgi:CRISPR system Cascade subunit CasA
MGFVKLSNASMLSSFNLVLEDWAPVRENGTRRRISLAELFSRAHEIQDLDPASPLAWIALFRLLLAISRRALSGPKNRGEWLSLHQLGRFPEAPFTEYLDQWTSKFDLFDQHHPFYQDSSLRGRNAASIAGLIPEAASGNNGTLFDHSSDAVETLLSPSDACLALLVSQTYGPGGLITRDPGEPTSAPGAPLAGKLIFLNQGKNLWETLVLNLVEYNSQRDRPFDANTLLEGGAADRPIWEREAQYAVDRAPYGYCDYLTWPSRRVLLEQRPDGLVSTAVIRSGTGLSKDWNQARWDPFMARRTSNPKKPNILSVQLSDSKALWRDSNALFSGQEADQNLAPRNITQLSSWGVLESEAPVLAIGVCTDKAKFLLWRKELWAIPAGLLVDPSGATFVSELVKTAEERWRSLRGTLRHVAENILPDTRAKAGKDRVADLVDSWSADRPYWSTLGSMFWRYVRRAVTEPHPHVLKDWNRLVSHTKTNALREVANSLGESHRTWRAIAIADPVSSGAATDGG